MTTLLLKTFQPLERVDELRATGELRGDWQRILGGAMFRPHYERMVEVMAEQGVDCGGRPPIWAWFGAVTVGDAHGLVGEYDLAHGWATVTFEAPRELVVLTDYDDWCEFYFGDAEQWDGPVLQPGDVDVTRFPCHCQATVPEVRLDWVTDIAPLPTSGFDDDAQSRPV